MLLFFLISIYLFGYIYLFEYTLDWRYHFSLIVLEMIQKYQMNLNECSYYSLFEKKME